MGMGSSRDTAKRTVNTLPSRRTTVVPALESVPHESIGKFNSTCLDIFLEEVNWLVKRVAGEFNVPHTCVTLVAEVDSACRYKRGVTGPDEIDQNGGQFKLQTCSG